MLLDWIAPSGFITFKHSFGRYREAVGRGSVKVSSQSETKDLPRAELGREFTKLSGHVLDKVKVAKIKRPVI